MGLFSADELVFRSGDGIAQGAVVRHRGSWCLVTDRRSPEGSGVLALPLHGDNAFSLRPMALHTPVLVVASARELLVESGLIIEQTDNFTRAVGALHVTDRGPCIVCQHHVTDERVEFGGVTLGGAIIELDTRAPFEYVRDFKLVVPLQDGRSFELP